MQENTGKYRGRPSYASKARRNGELHVKPSDPLALKWINEQFDNLNPGESFLIPAAHTHSLSENTLRNRVCNINRHYHTNIKMHIDSETGDWYFWFDPTPKQTISPSPTTRPKQPKGSIHCTLADVCAYWKINESTFRQLPWDVQLSKRITAGINLRAISRLGRIFDASNAHNK